MSGISDGLPKWLENLVYEEMVKPFCSSYRKEKIVWPNHSLPVPQRINIYRYVYLGSLFSNKKPKKNKKKKKKKNHSK